MPCVSVLVSTYNQPRWLELVLWGYAAQTFSDFELIVVDDGSGPETTALIDALRPQMPYTLRHFWHPDDGFRKCRAMNQAMRMASTDYLVLTDGDCIPRRDFLYWHLRLRAPRRFLTGGYCKLPMDLSQRITPADVLAGRATDYAWLAANGLQRHTLKLRTRRDWSRRLLDTITPVKPLLHGHNASLWTEDAWRVNGYDERMHYGLEDLEFGDRLRHAGIRGRTIRYSAVCVHLDHARGYVTDEMLRRNAQIRAETLRSRRTWTDHGIEQSGPVDVAAAA
jgi:glycosyltransferase involved in cell wall biosynthesis